MSRPIVVTRTIPAPPARVYALLADYQYAHPTILPRPPFTDLVVEQGGVGAGTVIRVGMRVLGRPQSFRATVTEPEPGRVLQEAADTGYLTRFIVEPDAEGHGATVTIHTEFPDRGGMAAAIERWMVRRLLVPTYERELELLAQRMAASS